MIHVEPVAPSAPHPPSRRTAVAICRVRPGDAAELRRFYAGLSAESRRLRFLGSTSGVTDREATALCTPDHVHEEGFVAVARGADQATGSRIVGHLCLEPAGDRTEEIAVAVADAWQRRGIGSGLFHTALHSADLRGVLRLTASAFGTNNAIARLLRSSRYPASVRMAPEGCVSISIDLTCRMNDVPRPAAA
jgi:GNAT superfamily N-acetyltransferase